ncbi:3-phosphoshikimate 1-carboxyvinyltransferase [Geobacter sulfurreducens]|uniref:3-phosphoshikimate 1-carboxyvinyltransferase n=1 Tax=Geobacter sulfurreducens (strain ATCC 51573 / DSM 12127 / PCA) TaxID=243231 RepID=AROA_GEOSL|nr:3-phosphoshikimate 1-carboxyvinyltransferase [Geobacter sulfurreducens]Q749Y6.1 RecName: Full=3-phosphoshikimate 1-carboxyvinyltransferase; AltName: Full=5-enolpyruvylshikimate-3-phosphate synthase; Short=EPSP synthase; Short=EPSPS [Geobacter sulfurreducens PCA]AAR35978.1 3-phosphoshikimate 1-carboxyvinyltransferase [Geobacter sulfurreducens PCA]ADI85356.1 3-phosphoshikimate 1-carboxyvinyltransferase [Geobacter sulfurreducens KN400]AJY68904.1 3-phosphoshikimate 1-carboxyvinyltransferase [Geo
MVSLSSHPARALRGEIAVPGDKSISHRSIMLGSIARGVTTVSGFLRGEDNIATLDAFRAMGVQVHDDGETLRIEGKGLHGLTEAEDVIDCGNSGTSIRLLTGLMAAQRFYTVLTGDRYLRRRPMRRVVEPLSRMGACIHGRDNGEKAPLAIVGRPLTGIAYDSPVASAQVKSALMLAGLYADGATRVTEPHLSRDHSERMFRHFGARLETDAAGVTVYGGHELDGRDIVVPGDISSAAFFLVAALIVPGSELLIRGVGVNPTRTGILDILAAMGGSVELLDQREVSGEPVADLLVRSSALKGIEIGGDVVPRAIDEFPVICVAAALAEGTTVIRDARELRVKETDRIAAMAANLRAAGATITETADGMIIEGTGRLNGVTVESFGDHRIAMSMLVAGLAASGAITVSDTECIATSFPTFTALLDKVAVR